MRTTTNFGLKITEGNDDWRDIFDDNADNMDTIDGLNGENIPIGEDSATMIREYIDAGMAEVVSEYDEEEGTYEVGDIVCYEGLNYQCKTAITTPESFVPAKWTRKKLAVSVADNTKAVDKLQHGMAIIVDGDTCATAVPVGGYAYVRNNTHGLAEGLYQNTSNAAFPVSGGTANSTVFTAVSGGLGSEVASLNSKIVNIGATQSTNGTVSSIANNTNTEVATLSLTPGTYILIRGCEFKENSTGIRIICTQSSISGRANVANGNAVNGKDTWLQLIEIKTVSSNTNVSLYAYQNSGSSLNIYPYLKSIRIA